MSYNYEFDKNRQRVQTCPCGKPNKKQHFAPYKGYDDKGYCHKCDKTFLPELEQPFYPEHVDAPKYIEQRVSYIEHEYLSGTFIMYEENVFVKYLIGLFGTQRVLELVQEYLIGTAKKWTGSTVFWQVDFEGKARTGKVMLYQENGHRVKADYNYIQWAHKLLDEEDFQLKQCFYGEHLLARYPDRKVAIVESEKTAVIASVWLPEFVWIATGGKTGAGRLFSSVVLKDREIVLFPDLGCSDEWEAYADRIPSINVSVDRVLESHASTDETEQGLDIADFLVKADWRSSRIGFKPTLDD